jgi:hypothetical protein
VDGPRWVDEDFWDPGFVDENVPGRLGLDNDPPDGMGLHLERLGGSPYHYPTATRSFTFKNPGYLIDGEQK